MRVLVFFDLPVTTATGRRNYIQFRKFLIKDGFFMMQESVYCKLAQNSNAANAIIDHIRRNKPTEGLVQALVITEKQYSNMEMIVGKRLRMLSTHQKGLLLYENCASILF